MSQLLTQEICRQAIDRFVTPVFESNYADPSTTVKRREGSLIIARAAVPGLVAAELEPSQGFYDSYVIYEHTWGANAIGAAQADDRNAFTSKSLQKAYGSIVTGEDYDPKKVSGLVEEHGLLAYPGAVLIDVTPWNNSGTGDYEEVVCAYTGLWYFHDEFIARTTGAGIKAVCSELAAA